MDETDRTAIHEVMEQQTVSIAKAGIVATLNARAAVLAAANPLYSRYNRHKSLSENINLPNSLLSRFDLMFLILDTPDVDKDIALARHVTFVHQNEGLEEKKDEDDDDEDVDMEDIPVASDFDEEKGTVAPRLLREYIARSRSHKPVVPPDVAPYIVEAYVSLRQQDRPGRQHKDTSGDQTVMTARQLLSILRLSQALARLRFSDYVAREDVDEAIRLTHMSKASLADETDSHGKSKRREDVMSRVFNIIRDYATTSQSTMLELKLCEAMILRKGFTAQQLQSCLEEYEALEIIQVNQNRTQIHFVT
jgi:DNA replication licensing factor MCM7